jgi:hypothetical protein
MVTRCGTAIKNAPLEIAALIPVNESSKIKQLVISESVIDAALR